MACLEAVARAAGVATGVQAVRVKEKRWFIPKNILRLWPHFFLDEAWLGFDAPCGSMEELTAQSSM
jgi:hypothetical protein